MNARTMNSTATAQQQRRLRRKSSRLSAEDDGVPALCSMSEKPRTTRSFDKRVERHIHHQQHQEEEFTENDIVKFNGDAFNPFAAASGSAQDSTPEVSNPLPRMRQQARKASAGTIEKSTPIGSSIVTGDDNIDANNNGDSKHSSSTALTMESSSRSNSSDFPEALTEELVVEVETMPVNGKANNDSLPCLMGMDSSASSYNLSKDCTLDDSSARLGDISNVISPKTRNLNIPKTSGMDVSLVGDNANMSRKRDSVRRSASAQAESSGPRRSSSAKNNKSERGSSKQRKSSSKSPTGKMDRSESSQQGRRRSSSRKAKKSLERGSSRRSMSASGKGTKKRSSSTNTKKKDMDQSCPEQQDRRSRKPSSTRKLKDKPPSTRRMSFGGAKYGAGAPLRRSVSLDMENRLPPTTHKSSAVAAQQEELPQIEGSATMVLETEEIGEGEMSISIVILRDDMKPMEDQSRMGVSRRTKATRRGSNESEITTSTRRRDSKAAMKRRGSNGSQLDDGSRATMKRRGSNGSQLDDGSRAASSKGMLKRRESNDASKMGDGSRARRPSSRRSSLVRSESNASLSESKGNAKRSNSNPRKVLRAPSNRSVASKGGVVRTNSGRSLASNRTGNMVRTNSGRSLVSRRGNMVRSQSSRSMASKGVGAAALRRQTSFNTLNQTQDTNTATNAQWGTVQQSTRRLLMEEDDPFADASAHNKMSTHKRSQTVTPATPRSRSKWGKLTSDKIRRSLSLSADQQTNKQIGELKVKPTSIPMEKFQSWEDGIKAVCRQKQLEQNGQSPKRNNALSSNHNTTGNNGRPGLMTSKTMSLRNMNVLTPTNNGNNRPGLMMSKAMSLRSMSVLNPSSTGNNGRPSMISKATSIRNMNVGGLLKQKNYAEFALD